MAYKVLNLEGERIIVDSIDPQIHKHLSGRDFTEDDACVKATSKKRTLECKPEERVDEVEEAGELDQLPEATKEYAEKLAKSVEKRVPQAKELHKKLGELSRDMAIKAYKEKYGRKPSSMMKLENIMAKL